MGKYGCCPICGVKLEHKYSQPRLCGQCRYVRESYGCTDERIAELRKEANDVNAGGAGVCTNQYGWVVRFDDYRTVMNEVLNGLEECERKRTHERAMYELRRGAAINRVASNLPSRFGSPESEDLKPECSERAPAEQAFFVVKDGRIVGEFARDAKMIQDWENWKADGRGWRR